MSVLTSVRPSLLSPHLQRLEDEAVHILREVVAEFRSPVMLYSVGKDSSVMLHLARKAFYPAPPPFPFLHIATGWDFRELLDHRDRMAAQYGLTLLTHCNEEAARAGVNPFDTEAGEYSRLMLTEALKAALDRNGFDAAFGGGRRDEEKSRAKERIFPIALPATSGIRATSGPSCGGCSIRGWRPAKRCGFSRCRTGPNSTSGPTSRPRRSRWFRSTLPPNGGSSSATAR